MSSTLPQYTRFPNPAHTSDESEHLLPRDGQSTRPWYATLFGSRSQAVDVADASSGTLSSSDDVSSIPDWYLSAMIATAQHNGREAARREVSVCSPGRSRVARARRWEKIAAHFVSSPCPRPFFPDCGTRDGDAICSLLRPDRPLGPGASPPYAGRRRAHGGHHEGSQRTWRRILLLRG